jgi:hypothetical protein
VRSRGGRGATAAARSRRLRTQWRSSSLGCRSRSPANLRLCAASLSYERVLIPGWLEGEVSVLLAPGEGGLTLPVDILLRKPFGLSPKVGVFLGPGLASEWFEAGEPETAYGVGTQVGGQYCLAPLLAIAVEAEYNLLLQPDIAHEVVVAAGGAFCF